MRIHPTLTRLAALVAVWCALSLPAYPAAVTRGYVERGGYKVLSSVTGANFKAQRSFPGSTVTVYETGTTTLSTIYAASDCVTPKSNPFTADSTGYYEFCAAAATYDLRFSGSEIAIPWTLSTVINEAATQTFPVDDTTQLVKGFTTSTKRIRMEADTYITAGQERVITMPDANTVLPIFAHPITFSGPSAARTVTMPDASITLINAAQPFVFTGTSASRTITWPDAATSIPNISQTLTITGPSAPRTITVPDAAFTVARTDATNTFTGNQTIAGNLLFTADATRDIGALAANRPNNGYFAGTLRANTLFVSSLDNGTASDITWFRNGIDMITLEAANIAVFDDLFFSSDNTLDIGAVGATRPRTGYFGTGLWIGAAGNLLGASANILTLQNATTAQAFRVYGSTTGPKYLNLSHDGTNAFAQSNSGIAYLGTSSGNSAVTEIQYAGTSRVLVANDDLYAGGTVDVGRTVPFRTGYFGTSLSSPLFFPPSGNPTLADSADTTKRLSFSLSGITTGNTRIATVPNSNFTMARTDAAQTFTGAQTLSTLILAGTTGSTWTQGTTSESITLSTVGATTDSVADMLPANSILVSVACRVTTTITTATDWKAGDATTAARFIPATATLTSGTTVVGLEHMKGVVSTTATGPTQLAAAKLRITTTGTPGAGVLSCTSMYISFTGPTS